MLKIAIIDVGHGGSDPGASGNGVVEKVANLETALQLKKDLEAKGVMVFITRTSDTDISLAARCEFANKIYRENPGAEIIFISIHHNAGGGDRSECIHSIYRGKGLELAEKIGNELQSHLGQAKKIYEKTGDDNKDYYYVIRNTSMDAVIVEVAFLDNVNDVQICDSPEEQRRNGSVIACGVLKFFGLKDSCIEESPVNPVLPSTNITVGSKVKIVGANYATGQNVPSWVKANTYTVGEIRGDKALIQEIVSLVYLNDLTVVGGIESQPASFNVGDRVIVVGNYYTTGQRIPGWVKGVPMTIQQLGNKGALIKEIVSWVKIADLKKV